MTDQMKIEQGQTDRHDGTVNGIHMETLQGTVNAIAQEPDLGQCRFRARNKWLGGNHNRTTITGFYGARQEIAHRQKFELDADEPAILAGNDDGANPVEHLLNALAACVTTSMVAHAAVRGIHIEELESELEGDIDLQGFLGLSKDVPRGFTDIRIKFSVKADVDNMERLKRLTQYSPVLNTITQGTNVDIQVETKQG
ncbi:MAG: OsmC family protein [Pseudomonadota bacterium]